MRKRLSSLTRRSLVGVVVGLAFAAAAGVGLAQITAGSTPSAATTSTTGSQTTSTQTTSGDLESQSADEQGSQESDFESESADNGNQTSTALSTISTTAPLTTTGGAAPGDLGTGQTKVDVCHKTGNGGQHTINIATPAVQAHVAHGDTLGVCVAIAATTSNAATTSTTSTTSHGQKPNKPKNQHFSGPTTTSSSHGNSGHAGVKSHGKGGHAHTTGGGKGHGK